MGVKDTSRGLRKPAAVPGRVGPFDGKVPFVRNLERLFGIWNKGRGSRILRGWDSDLSGDAGLEFCVVVGMKWGVGVRFIVWGVG
jgi:hypothetical protein